MVTKIKQMKNKFNYLVLAIVLLMSSNIAFGQGKDKLGHIDSNKLLQIMPERAQAQKAIEAHAKKLEETLGVMKTEFEKKYTAYAASADSLSPLIRQTKEAELGELQQRIQAFQQQAQQELMNKENELIKPIVDKLRKAIDEVATANGYTYIFDIGSGSVVHYPKDKNDISDLVKKKLGIK